MAASLARLARRSLTAANRSHVILASCAQSTDSAPDRVKWDYRGQRQIIPLGQWLPKVAVDAYVAPNALLAGQVTVYDGASVWNGAATSTRSPSVSAPTSRRSASSTPPGLRPPVGDILEDSEVIRSTNRGYPLVLNKPPTLAIEQGAWRLVEQDNMTAVVMEEEEEEPKKKGLFSFFGG